MALKQGQHAAGIDGVRRLAGTLEVAPGACDVGLAQCHACSVEVGFGVGGINVGGGTGRCPVRKGPQCGTFW